MMALVDPNTLAGTLANINEALLRGERLPRAQAAAAAEWITSRIEVFGSYRGLPAPTGRDRHTKLRLFTGEIVGSHAGTGCKLGFEATWALTVLKPSSPAVRRAAESCRRITIGLFAREVARRRGMYCCYSCSVAGWRALGATGGKEAGGLLEDGIAALRASREKSGRWSNFPFWYTVLSLSDLEEPSALAELRHAARALERALAVRGRTDAYGDRRRLLAKHVLERVA